MHDAIYLGSQTLLERDGTWVVEHRDHNNALTCTETVGDLLALNYRLLGLTPPTSTNEPGNTNRGVLLQVRRGGDDPSHT